MQTQVYEFVQSCLFNNLTNLQLSSAAYDSQFKVKR